MTGDEVREWAQRLEKERLEREYPGGQWKMLPGKAPMDCISHLEQMGPISLHLDDPWWKTLLADYRAWRSHR